MYGLVKHGCGKVAIDVGLNELQQAFADAKGTYVLIFHLHRLTVINVGRLGKLNFKRGWYAYVGSAFGPGGLGARLRHHGRTAPNPRWHVDYLKNVAMLREIWVGVHRLRREHDWADILCSAAMKSHGIHGFGCSDCGCDTHLFHFNRRPAFGVFASAVQDRFPGDPPAIRMEQSPVFKKK